MKLDLFSVDIEKTCLAGLIMYPELYFGLPNNIKETDFYTDINRYLYPFIVNAIKEKGSLNPTLIADSVNQTGYTPAYDVSIKDYLEALSLLQITKFDVEKAFDELKKYSVCRNLIKTAQKMVSEVRSNISKPLDEIIAKTDAVYGNKTDIYMEKESQFTNVFGSMRGFLEEVSANPVEERGVSSPFPVFNKYFGGFRDGDVYVWASRAKQGKSTLLSWLGWSLSRQRTYINQQVKVLYLDTEILTRDFMLRLAAAISGVPFWYVDTGNFKTNPEFNMKINEALKKIEAWQPYLYHRHVSNLNIDQIVSVIKHWYYLNCSDGKSKAVIVYDYLKLTNERVSGDWKEYQVMGEKINRLKEVVTEIAAPLLTAIQINRSGVTTNKDEVVDDESVIALSDRISWFASFLGIFRRNSKREIDEIGGFNNGSHRMIPLNVRFQGKQALGHDDLIKTETGWKQNYINYTVKNFEVIEGQSLADLEAKKAQAQILGDSKSDEVDHADLM